MALRSEPAFVHLLSLHNTARSAIDHLTVWLGRHADVDQRAALDLVGLEGDWQAADALLNVAEDGDARDGALAAAAVLRTAQRIRRSEWTVQAGVPALWLAPEAPLYDALAPYLAGMTSVASVGLLPEERDRYQALSAYAASVLAPQVPDGDEPLLVTGSVMLELADQGCWRRVIPEAYGGAVAWPDPLTTVIDGQALSEAGLAVGALAGHPVLLLQALLHGGTEAQRKRWLPGIARGETLASVAYREVGAGEDPALWACVAQRTETGWVLSGAKQAVWFAGQATLLAVAARIADQAGGIGWFLVDKPESTERQWSWDCPLGGRLTGEVTGGPAPGGVRRDTVHCDRLQLSAEALIGETPTAAHGTAVYMTGWAVERLHLTAMAVGALQSAYESSWRATVGRLMAGRQGLDSPVIRQHLASMAVRLQAARQFAYRAAKLLARGGSPTAAALSQWYAINQCETASRLLQVWLSEPGRTDVSLWRAWRQVSAVPLLAGSNEVLALGIAPDLLRESRVR